MIKVIWVFFKRVNEVITYFLLFKKVMFFFSFFWLTSFWLFDKSASSFITSPRLFCRLNEPIKINPARATKI